MVIMLHVQRMGRRIIWNFISVIVQTAVSSRPTKPLLYKYILVIFGEVVQLEPSSELLHTIISPQLSILNMQIRLQ